MSLSPFGSSTSANFFQPVNIGADLLGAAFNASLALSSSANALNAALLGQLNAGPAVIPPWQIDTGTQTLARRLAEVRNLDQFINLKSSAVKSAGDNRDDRATFALFEALTALQTLAQAAAETSRASGELPRLDAQFQRGLAQVQDYLGTVDLDQLDLLFGAKQSSAKSTVTLGRSETDYDGKVLLKGAGGQAIPGLDGTEQFTVSLTKAGRTDDILVDLANITGTLTIDAVVAEVNAAITAIPVLDGNGDPVLDGNGNPTPLYLTRFKVGGNGIDGQFITIDGTLTETTKLSTPQAEPALYLAGTVTPIVTSGETFSRLTKLQDLNGAVTTGSRQDITATDLDQQALNDAIIAADDEARPASAAVETKASAIATDPEGFVYVVGSSNGDIEGQLGDGETDVFLSKYDSNGALIFSRSLGAIGDASGLAIATDANGNVAIAGTVDGKVASGDAITGTDAFAVKFNRNGNEVFRYQLDTAGTSAGLGVALTQTGDVILSGRIQGGATASLSALGGADGFALRLDGATGLRLDAAQFGTAQSDAANAVTVAADGNILVAGIEDGNGVVRKLDINNLSNTLATFDLGALSGGTIASITVATVGGVDKVIVGGSTSTALNGTQLSSASGGVDGFVSFLDDQGAGFANAATRYIGSSANDAVNGISVSGDKLYVGGTAGDALPGATRFGPTDTFVVRLDIASGAVELTKQIGQFGNKNQTTGIAVSDQGGGVLADLGLRAGTIQTSETHDIVSQTSVNAGDFFHVAVNGGRKVKITINTGDTFARIAARINRLGFASVKASASSGPDGEKFEIKPVGKGQIQLFAGDPGRDALAKIGIEPQLLLPADRLFGIGDQSDDQADELGGAFALGLASSFHLRDKTTAKYVLSKIDSAIGTIQRAFRSLRFDPVAAALEQRARLNGPVPAFLTKQIAGYQDALARLQASSVASTGGLL